MDNFREWLSDNLRYFMLGGVILIIVAVLFFSIRACTGSGKGTSDGEQTKTTAQDNSQGNDPSSPEDDGETNDGKKEEDTNPLEDGSEEIAALMNSYYKALGKACTCSSVDRAVVSGTMCGGSIPFRCVARGNGSASVRCKLL